MNTREEAVRKASELMGRSNLPTEYEFWRADYHEDERPHWSVVFGWKSPEDYVDSPGCSIVLVYDDGEATFFEVL